MYGYSSPEEDQPVLWLRGHPVYAAYLIVLVYVASMLATTVLMALNFAHLLSWLPFASAEVLRGQVWRLVTYGLVNPPSLNFAIDMAIIALFGREVEKFFGRRKFLLLYGGIYLVTPVLFTALGVWFPTSLAGETGAFALFIAFATLYPDVAVFFGLLAKWIAVILVAVYTLIALAYHNWLEGLSLWATTGLAFAFVRHQQGRLTLPRLRLPRRAPKLRLLQGGDAPVAAKPLGRSSMAEVDALLDKIARSGVSSLTAKERATLDSARAELLKRETGAGGRGSR